MEKMKDFCVGWSDLQVERGVGRVRKEGFVSWGP